MASPLSKQLLRPCMTAGEQRYNAIARDSEESSRFRKLRLAGNKTRVWLTPTAEDRETSVTQDSKQETFPPAEQTGTL